MRTKERSNKRIILEIIKALVCLLLTILVSMNLGYYLGQQSTKPGWHETPIEKLFVEYKN